MLSFCLIDEKNGGGVRAGGSFLVAYSFRGVLFLIILMGELTNMGLSVKTWKVVRTS